MSVTRIKRYIVIAVVLFISIPVHEYGHYAVAERDGAQIYEYNYFVNFEDGRFSNLSITVNELTFSSPLVLIEFYLAGFLIILVPGLLVSSILYFMRSNYWEYPFMWVISAPLVSLSDFNRLFELLDLMHISRWIYVALGVISTLMLGFMRGTNFDVHGTRSI